MRKSIFLLLFIGTAILASSEANAGFLANFCGLTGIGRSPAALVVATAIVAGLAAMGFAGKLGWELVFLFCFPIILLMSGSALMYVLGEDCKPPSDEGKYEVIGSVDNLCNDGFIYRDA